MAGKGVGFTKNCFDLLNVTIAITLGMVFAGRLVGVGLGTIIAMFGVGRVIALFNSFCLQADDRAGGGWRGERLCRSGRMDFCEG